MILDQWPVEFTILQSRLNREQPTIYHQVAVYMYQAINGDAPSVSEMVYLLNKKLNCLVLPEMTITEACERWLKALNAMTPEVGSIVNPKPIVLLPFPTSDSIH